MTYMLRPPKLHRTAEGTSSGEGVEDRLVLIVGVLASFP